MKLSHTAKVALGAAGVLTGLAIIFWPRGAGAVPLLEWRTDGPMTIKPRNQSLTYKGAGNLLTGRTYDEIMNGSTSAVDAAGTPQTDITDPENIPIY